MFATPGAVLRMCKEAGSAAVARRFTRAWVVLMVVAAVGLMTPAGRAQSAFTLDLTMVARTVTGSGGAETVSDILPGGVVNAVPGTRYRVEVRYRIQDNVPNAVGSRGLRSADLMITRTMGTGTTARARLTIGQQTSANIVNPDVSGFPAFGQADLTGLTGPFRGELVGDAGVGNGDGTGVGSVRPFASQAPEHRSWTPNLSDSNGQPTPGNSNSNLQRWTVYAFDFVYQSGRVTFAVEAMAASVGGPVFTCFTQTGGSADVVPTTSTLATIGSIAFDQVAGACCTPSGCVVATQAQCAQFSGTLAAGSLVCGPGVCSEFRLELSLVARSVSGAAGTEVITDVQDGGTVQGVVGTRYRVELRYRVRDLLADEVGSRGLSAALIQLTRAGSSTGVTSRGLLTFRQVDDALPLNPDTSGITTPGDGPLTGLVGPFRGGVMMDGASVNGGPDGLAGLTTPLVPLALSAPQHLSWRVGPGTDAPSAMNTDANPARWTVYTFEFVYQGGTVLLRASALGDSETGNRFACFVQRGTVADPVPVASASSVDASLMFTDGLGACCTGAGCAVVSAAACAGTGGVFVGLGTACGGPLCLAACCATDLTCTLTSRDACVAAGGRVTDETVCRPGLCCVNPVLTLQSPSGPFAIGSTLSVSVQATHPLPLSYQWLKQGVVLMDGGRISGATSPTLMISMATAGDEGGYQCRITSACGTSIVSGVISRTACLPPFVAPIVANVTAPTGQSVVLRVSASGAGTLSYRWRRNGVDLVDGGRISGVQTTTLTIQAVEPLDEGPYECAAVSTVCGSGVSSPIVLTVVCTGSFDCNSNGVCDERELRGLNDVAASQPRAGGEFATRVETDGTRMIVTEPGFAVGSETNAGRALVYGLNGTSAAFSGQVTPTASVRDARFGTGAAIGGEWVAIGAPGETAGGQTGAGAVHIFRNVGLGWQFFQRVTEASPRAGARFGSAVSLDGDRLVVGAPGAERVGVYRYNTINWAVETQIVGPDASGASEFGAAVDVDDPYVVVSAPAVGQAWVFYRGPVGWQSQGRLRPRSGVAEVGYGAAVAIFGDVIAVGSSGEDVGGVIDAGAAYMFRRTDTRWTQQRRVRAQTPVVGGRFGASVALVGETLVVGESGRAVAGVERAGSASVFTRRGNFWFRAGVLDSPRATSGDGFGSATAIGPAQIVIGARTGRAAGLDGAGWLRLFSGRVLDCNSNGRPDVCDVANGADGDANGNAIPDSCDRSLCVADFDDSGAVGVQDVFDFVTDYLNGNLTADFNDSGTLSVQDVFDFLTAFFVPC